MSIADLTGLDTGRHSRSSVSAAAWGTGLGLAACVGLTANLSAGLFILAGSPGMTRGRKRALVGEYLPEAMVALAMAAAIGIGMAMVRRGSLDSALLGGKGMVGAPKQRLIRGLLVVSLLSLSTPIFQVLVGLDAKIAQPQFIHSISDAIQCVFGLFSVALQEDVLLRWVPIELVLLLGFRSGSRGRFKLTLASVLLSGALAAFAHAFQGPGLPTLETLLLYGLPKVPAGLVLAWIYVRFGAVEAWLTHFATNLAIWFVLPQLV